MMLMCNARNKIVNWVVAIVGLISLVFGVLWVRTLPDEAHNLNILAGMFAGMGGALVAVGVYGLIRMKLVPAEKLLEEQIEKNDERNILIRQRAYAVTSTATIILYVVMAFVFIWWDYQIPAFITIGAMYVHLIIFLIAVRVLRKKM